MSGVMHFGEQFGDKFNAAGASTPSIPSEKSKPVSGHVGPTGPQMPPAYPSTSDSLHTWAGDFRSSDGTASGLRDESFWRRVGAAAFQFTFISFITGFITFLAFVVTKENGTFTQIHYSLIVGLSAALQLILSQASGKFFGAPMLAFEIWMEHYSTYVHAPFYRIIYWLAMTAAKLVGYAGAGGLVWALQASNAATHAGLPTVQPLVPSIWWAAALQMLGTFAIRWTSLHVYYNPEAASDANQSNAPLLVGLVTFLATYITLPYTEGGFDFERYLVLSIWSGYWISTGWIYAAGEIVGSGAACGLWWPIYRTTRIGASSPKQE